MKKTILILSVLLCSITITSCEKNIIYESESTFYTTADIDICDNQPCPAINLSILNLNEPAIASTNVNSWINGLTIQTLYNDTGKQPETIEDALDIYINNSQISYPESTELSDAHEISIETAIAFGSNDILSILFYSYQFSGGASGFDYEMYLNLDPQTGKEYLDEELFTEDFYAFAKAQFEQEYPDEIFNLHGNNALIQYLKQVGFTEEGIVLIYNDMGEESLSLENKQITIPWEQAEDYLTF